MNPLGTPLEKHVVLVGAGNAHLVFVNRWGMMPWPGVSVTLISEAPVIPYSAMVPGHIAGQYSADEITIDLVRLTASRGVRFIPGVVTAIDPKSRQVHFADRPPLTYDVVSLGVGSLPACPDEALDHPDSLLMRPLGSFIRRLNDLEQRWLATRKKAADASSHSAPARLSLVVVGGGASGCELTLALHRRLAHIPSLRLTLIQAHDRLMPNHAAGVGRRFADALKERGVELMLNQRVKHFRNGRVELDTGESLPADAVVWATPAAPTDLLRHAGLPVNQAGFLRVRATLQAIDRPEVFGTGDCVAFEEYPTLPRNGVHAVRQGRVLFDNVKAFLRGHPLRPFRPQRWTLALLNTADGRAVLSYGRLAAQGYALRRFKDWIDRRWMKRFDVSALPVAMGHEPSPSEPKMQCGGCGSKVSGDVLREVLKRLPIPDDPRIVLGCRAGEDAAAHRVQPELYGAEPGRLIEVQTVDYFKTFLDDPYLFGRIAGQHAVSDLFAMNARPFAAMALATLPFARGPIHEALLFEMLSGALHTFRELGVVLTGGHTTEGPELALGFAVTGFAEEDQLFRKGALEPGDRLMLTKPLGTGALLAAWRLGQCRADWFNTLIQTMLRPNRPAAEVLRDAGVRACTDVTGFGLAGHLLEMLDASRVSARIDPRAVPLLPGFNEVTARGILSSLHPDNAKAGCRVVGAAEPWLFDPQTSGGLLVGAAPDIAESLLKRLRQVGDVETAIIGEVIATDDPPQIVLGRSQRTAPALPPPNLPAMSEPAN